MTTFAVIVLAACLVGVCWFAVRALKRRRARSTALIRERERLLADQRSWHEEHYGRLHPDTSDPDDL